jgi:hypothetical protein
MSIYNKPVSQIRTADLQELLAENAVENARLEFKLEVPGKDETLKKLSSFANTFGGYMVVGAKASSSDGRVEDLPGVDEQQGYKQKIVQWCFEAANPPLNVEVSDPIAVPGGTGKVAYVVYVAESDLAPHFLNGRKGMYVRTDEFSSRFETRLADERELRHLLDRRRLILDRRAALLRRAGQRFDAYVARTHTDKSGSRTQIGPFLRIDFVPRFPSRPLAAEQDLKSLIMQNYVPWRGIIFPNFASNSILSQHESAMVLGAAGRDKIGRLSFFEANMWGLLHYTATIADAENPDKTFGIHLYGFVGFLLLFVRHAATLIRAFGYSGPVHIEANISSILGIPWLHGDNGPGIFQKSGSELDNDIAFTLTKDTEELQNRTDEVVGDLLRIIFFAVNWSGLIDTPEKAETLIRNGYRYNSWQR